MVEGKGSIPELALETVTTFEKAQTPHLLPRTHLKFVKSTYITIHRSMDSRSGRKLLEGIATSAIITFLGRRASLISGLI